MLVSLSFIFESTILCKKVEFGFNATRLCSLIVDWLVKINSSDVNPYERLLVVYRQNKEIQQAYI